MAPEPLKELPLFNVEDAQFVYRTNFAGVEQGFDSEGDYNFNLKLDMAPAPAMEADGWNVKWTQPGKNATPEMIAEHIPEPFIKVNIGFKFRAPTIFLIRNGKGTIVTERTIGTLDSCEFDKVDVVVTARRHEQFGGGYKAWQREFYGHVTMSEIGSKYAYLLENNSGAELDELAPGDD